MKRLAVFGVLAIGCVGTSAIACSLDGLPGGRYSPFYALAHSSLGSQSPLSNDSPETRSTPSDSDVRARGKDASNVDAVQDQPSQSGTTPDWNPATSSSSVSPTDGNPSEKVTA